mgnify:CR=1 FL=1
MPDIFPTIEEATDAEFFDGDLNENTLNPDVAIPRPYGFSWKFDFTAGDFFVDQQGNMRVVREHDCLHDWIGHTLSTERYETPIFGGDIGTVINRLVGEELASDPHTIAVIEREIREAIMVHDRIVQVQSLAVIPIDYEVFVYMRFLTDDAAVITEVVSI